MCKEMQEFVNDESTKRRIVDILAIMQNFSLTFEEAAKGFNIPEPEYDFYRNQVEALKVEAENKK